jgi:hypothetical protein
VVCTIGIDSYKQVPHDSEREPVVIDLFAKICCFSYALSLANITVEWINAVICFA